MKRMKLFVVVALALSICLPGAVMASPIGVFSGTVESFERIAPDRLANGTGGVEGSNNFTIGHGAVTTFTSGVTFTTPLLPAGSYDSGDPFINDFAITPTVSNSWNTGPITAADVPGGTAWVGAYHASWNPSVVQGTLEFTLPSPMTRVGAYMDGQTYAGLTMRTYDAADNLLDTRTVTSVNVALWKTNWIGSQIDSGQLPISKVVFSGNDFGVDNLTFSAAAVPIPPSALLLGSGLLGLVGMAWRRRQES